jgi:hypothetical protein
MPAAVSPSDWLAGGGSSYREELGVPVEYRRRLLVTGLSAGSGASMLTSRIAEAKTALSSAGFGFFTSPTGLNGLKLVNYEYSTIDEENSKLAVTVTYINRRDAVGPVGTWTPIISGTLQQIQTAKDYLGFPISVQHDYPSWDPNFPGERVAQGGRVTQQLPLVEITYRGLIQPASALLEKFKYLGRINASTWLYGPRGTWMCTNFNTTIHDAGTSPTTWLAEVTFQAEPNGWFPLAVFTDPVTGVPPANLTSFGIQRVWTQPYAEFNQLIPQQ